MSMSCSWDSTSEKYKIKYKEIGSLQFTLTILFRPYIYKKKSIGAILF
jgi:hypothetical protein